MAVLHNMPPSLREILASPPDKGNRNLWLFTVAARARHVASPAKVRAFLQRVSADWDDRDFSPEIERAVERAFALPADPTPAIPKRKTPDWPAFNAQGWARRIAFTPLFDFTPLSISAEAAIDALFPGDPLLCCATNTRAAVTQPRAAWRGFESAQQFIVPNPMRAHSGHTTEGRISHRCNDNACHHRTYIVVEFDLGTPTEQACVLSSLSSPATPLVMVVWSAGKSFHGWFHVGALNEYHQLRFFRLAAALGADASLWDRSKLVRFPGGRRSPANLIQTIHFFQPKPD